MSKLDDPYSTTAGSSTTPGSSLTTQSSSSNKFALPPPFEDSTGTIVPLEENHPTSNTDESPPQFSQYVAEYFLDSSGDIISHDPHLNEDGEALYRFLLQHAATPPTFTLRCFGSHTEQHTRWVTTSDSNGSHSRTETYTETITDFDFRVDLGQHLQLSPYQWSIADTEPAYRGKMVREVEINGQRHTVNRKENKSAENWRAYRIDRGLPPWITESSGGGDMRVASSQTPVFQSSKTVRQWADDYCASNKVLKEFIYEKVIHGWNIGALTQSIQDTINSTHYTGKTQISFDLNGSKIYVRPSTSFSRALSNKWFKFLLWIFLIYPFIWLFKRFHSQGGGQWRVCGSAFALKRWRHLPDSLEGEDVAQYLIRKQEESQSGQKLLESEWRPDDSRQGGASGNELKKLIKTSNGISSLVGLQEGEWFRSWEGTIRRAVMARLSRPDAMTAPDDRTTPGVWLEGYAD